MAPASVQLQDDQKFALMKFRRSVHDLLKPEHNDQFLLRWLRARNWDADAAEKMLRDSMEWRKKWGVDTTLKDWQPPEVVEKYMPSGVAGITQSGAPLVILPFSGFDIWGMLHSATKDDIIRKVIIVLENILEQSRQNGTHEVVVIIDMENFNIKPYVWKPATELVISLIQMYEANCPEILNMCYIINAPSIFSLGFNVVKRFMGEFTISKIHIYKADPKKWQPILRQNIPLDVLPKHFGGEAVDPDGNPRCVTKIKQGGKIPKEYYCKNQLDDRKSEFVSETVKKGKQFTLDFVAIEEGSILRWEFRTEDHDIKFGVTCRDSEGAETIPVPLHKVNSNIVNEIGYVNCDSPATYSVIFDNTYSMMRNKKLHYDIEMTIPLDKLDLNLMPEEAVAEETLNTAL